MIASASVLRKTTQKMTAMSPVAKAIGMPSTMMNVMNKARSSETAAFEWRASMRRIAATTGIDT